MTRSPYIILTAAVVPFTAFAAENPIEIQDEIIVAASRVAQDRLEVGSAVDVLNEDDIQARQRSFISDLLRDLPGLAVNRTGPAGAFTQVRLRGAEANHTLVVIDGIEVGDPFNAGEFEFAHLLSDDVSRIEVLRGPQSALWGSDAIGGVINVSTGSERDQAGPWANGFLERGSFGTVHGSARTGTSGAWGGIRGSLAYMDIRGISASPTGSERDGYDNLTANVHTDLNVTDTLSVALSARHVNATVDQDAQDFDFLSPTEGLVIDSDGFRKSSRWYGRAAAELSLMDGQWTHQFSTGLTDSSNDEFSGGEFSFGSDGQKWDVEYQSDYSFSTGVSATHAVSALLEYEGLTYENFSAGGGPENQKQSGHQWSGALQYRLGMSDQVFLGAAVRFDDHQRFDNETTYRLTVAWAVPEAGLKLRGSYGAGAAQPSFFELFGFNPNFFIGNPNLKPETSEGWDAGVDYAFENGQGLASLTYFDSNLKSEIFTDFTVFPFTVTNRGGTSTRDGVEASLRYLPLDSVQLSASYTYTDAKDDNGSRELRRPRHTGSVNATYRFLEGRATIDFGLNYNGTMHDSEFILATPETVVTLDDYILGTVAASYALSHSVELIGRVENLFDENYQDVFGFASPGIGFYLGVRVGFRGQ